MSYLAPEEGKNRFTLLLFTGLYEDYSVNAPILQDCKVLDHTHNINLLQQFTLSISSSLA